MDFAKYVVNGMIVAGTIGVPFSLGYSVYTDQIDRGLGKEISKVEEILNHKEMLGKLDTDYCSNEYKKATEREIECLEIKYQEQSKLVDLPSLKRKQEQMKMRGGLESMGLIASLTVLVVGLAKKYPEKKNNNLNNKHENKN
jgi:hypothetical protein